MIVFKDKLYQTRSDKPNENWTDEENVFVVEDGTELAHKIEANPTYFNFVLDVEGNLIDITPTERPPEPPTEPTPTDLLQEDNASLWYENMIQSARVEANEAEVSGLWYELMMGGI